MLSELLEKLPAKLRVVFNHCQSVPPKSCGGHRFHVGGVMLLCIFPACLYYNI